MQKLPVILLTLMAIGCSSKKEYPLVKSSLEKFYDADLAPFYHGVASGDPLQNAVVIWTKITPTDSVPSITGEWEVASRDDFTGILLNGKFQTSPEKDFTVKVDVKGLDAGTTYFYRFKVGETYSAVGRTKTTPISADSLKFAVVSCSNYEQGFFNAYARIAERTDIDAVIHLGDYIYEYQAGKYGDSTTGRFHEPPHEIVKLYDYRTRYAQYRLDKDLRTAHQNHPFITIWDDHEIANNSYQSGAQNHQPEEGDYGKRKSAARQAYYEWLPVRESPKLYRSVSYGNLAELIMLDERIEGRTAPVDSVDHPAIGDTTRHMLGVSQMNWLKDKLSQSTSQWKIIGNQVIFSYLNWGYAPNFTINMDSWDGYPAERSQIIQHIKNENLENIVFITGDTHSSWALEVTEDPFGDYQENGAVAVEFGTASINSANSNERFPTDTVKIHEKRIVGAPLNPQLKYTNLRDHGYLELTLLPEEVQARYYYVDKINEPSSVETLAKTLRAAAGENVIRE